MEGLTQPNANGHPLLHGLLQRDTVRRAHLEEGPDDPLVRLLRAHMPQKR